jgi:hypothetical protein
MKGDAGLSAFLSYRLQLKEFSYASLVLSLRESLRDETPSLERQRHGPSAMTRRCTVSLFTFLRADKDEEYRLDRVTGTAASASKYLEAADEVAR